MTTRAGEARPHGPPIERRTFVFGAAGFGGALLARTALAQERAPQQNFLPMEQGAYRPTLLPAKPNAAPQLTDEQRDALEHRIKCQCGCILDVYTCRTTDFTCQVSPAMHRDVIRLIASGYGVEEILAAFVRTYGEVALTAPVKQGFNWAGYLAPGIVMAAGAVMLTMLVRKWATESRVAAEARDATAAAGPPVPGVSDDDLARLERALREDA